MKFFRFIYGNSFSDTKLDTHISAEVNLYTECLSRAYKFYFSPIKTEGISTIVVYLVDELTEQKIIEYGTFTAINLLFDRQYFKELTEERKSEYIATLCHSSIVEYVKDKGWDIMPFMDAFTHLQDSNYKFIDYYGRQKSSPDRKKRARIWFVDDYSETGTFVEFSDRIGLRTNLVKFTPSGLSVFNGDVKDLSWVDNECVKVPLGDERRSEYWLVNRNGEVNFISPETDDAHQLFRLGQMYWDGVRILKDEKKGIDLIRKAAEQGYKHAVTWLNRNCGNNQLSKEISH